MAEAFFDTSIGSAIFSPCGLYRYTLERKWAEWPRYVLWLMLNPSTADQQVNDATVRRCMGYARAWGYSGILVGNLFAYRATHPRDLERAMLDGVDIVGPENDRHLASMASRSRLIVAAWGSGAPDGGVRRWAVLGNMHRGVHLLHYLTLNHPRTASLECEPGHPLRLKKDLKPIPWDYMPDHGPGAGG